MELNKDFPKPEKTDNKAPELLKFLLSDLSGEIVFEDTIKQKHFSSGSIGYNCSGKFTNKESGERYQVSCNIILIGSKPK